MAVEKFIVKFAQTEKEKNATYALRYNDMVKEYNPDKEIECGLDITEHDAVAKQIICVDTDTDEVVGCYRILCSQWMKEGSRFQTEDEFDISELKATGENIVELSRAVIKKEYRNTTVLMNLLRFIMKYIMDGDFRFVIGETSFFGTDKQALQEEISYLTLFHGVEDFDIKALQKNDLAILPKEQINQAEVKRKLPPLVRAYIGFGAKIGKEAFADYDFGSVDVFTLMDTQNYNTDYIQRFLRI